MLFVVFLMLTFVSLPVVASEEQPFQPAPQDDGNAPLTPEEMEAILDSYNIRYKRHPNFNTFRDTLEYPDRDTFIRLIESGNLFRESPGGAAGEADPEATILPAGLVSEAWQRRSCTVDAFRFRLRGEAKLRVVRVSTDDNGTGYWIDHRNERTGWIVNPVVHYRDVSVSGELSDPRRVYGESVFRGWSKYIIRVTYIKEICAYGFCMPNERTTSKQCRFTAR